MIFATHAIWFNKKKGLLPLKTPAQVLLDNDTLTLSPPPQY
jgi:hypothetical protein